jgi:F-type H+-transporting ATPase subunit b
LATAIFPCLLASLPVRAEEGGDKGLPQLDTTLFPEQLFWLAISFGALYLLMSRVALPRVARTQGTRRQVIASELQAAQAASDTAQATSAQVEKSLVEARSKAQASVSEMIAKVAEESAVRQAKQERELSRRLHSAEQEISVTREAALNAVRASAAELAASVIEKVIGTRVQVKS